MNTFWIPMRSIILNLSGTITLYEIQKIFIKIKIIDKNMTTLINVLTFVISQRELHLRWLTRSFIYECTLKCFSLMCSDITELTVRKEMTNMVTTIDFIQSIDHLKITTNMKRLDGKRDFFTLFVRTQSKHQS